MTRIDLRCGARIRWHDEPFEVVARAATSVTLRHLITGEEAQVLVTHLLSSPLDLLSAPTSRTPPASAFLDALPQAVRQTVAVRVEHLQEAMCGYRLGSAHLAVAGEPREQFDPATTSLPQRLGAKSRELAGTEHAASVKTLYRWRQQFIEHGPIGLADARYRDFATAGAHLLSPEYLELLDRNIRQYATESSRPMLSLHTQAVAELKRTFVDAQILNVAQAAHADPQAGRVIVVPGRTMAYKLLRVRGRAVGIHNSAVTRQSIALVGERAIDPFVPAFSGQVVQFDSTVADFFAIDRRTGIVERLEIAVGIDGFDRQIVACRMAIQSARGIDAAFLFKDAMSPMPWRPEWGDAARWDYAGLPERFVLPAPPEGQALSAKPFGHYSTALIDHGKIYLNQVTRQACSQFDISITPAPPRAPFVKGIVEQFFHGLSEWPWALLGSHTGRSVDQRGLDPEGKAALYVDQVEAFFWYWALAIYRHKHHTGCQLPGEPQIDVSPKAMREHSLVRLGSISTLTDPADVAAMLPPEWRTIQRHGVEIGGLRYSDNRGVLEYWRTQENPYDRKERQHPFRLDPRDLSTVYFFDPRDGTWVRLHRNRSLIGETPFSDAVLAWAKRRMRDEGIRKQDYPHEVEQRIRSYFDEQALGPTETSTKRERQSRARMHDDVARSTRDLKGLAELDVLSDLPREGGAPAEYTERKQAQRAPDPAPRPAAAANDDWDIGDIGDDIEPMGML